MKKSLIMSLLAVSVIAGSVVIGSVSSSSERSGAEIIKDSSLEDNNENIATEDDIEEDIKDVVDENNDDVEEDVKDVVDENNDDVEEVEDETLELKFTIDSNVNFEKILSTSEPTFNTQWKTNEFGTGSICIDGRGEDAIEEGEGTIYLKTNGSLYKIRMTSDDNLYTPVYVEWVSEDEFIVQTSAKYGTVRTGGKIYKLNVNDLTPHVVYDLKENESMVDTYQLDEDTLMIRTDSEGKTRTASSADIIVDIN